MTIDVLSRDQWQKRYLRSFQIRVPDADVRKGTAPWIDAVSLADQLSVLSEYARRNSAASLDDKTGDQLVAVGVDIGVPKPGATGAIGYVLIGAASTGTTIFHDDELVAVDTGLRYRCTQTGAYSDGDAVPIAGIDTGSETNLDAATLLRWSSPRPGCDPIATVQEQPDGTGLTGGRPEYNDDEYRDLLREAQSNPASAGNDAAYQQIVEYSPGHGVQVEKCFTYPAVFAAGTTAIVFTLKPSRPGGSRIPNAAQLADVAAYLGERMPVDDSWFMCQLLAQNADVYLRTDWDTAATGWEDVTPWPPYYPTTAGAGAPGTVVVTTVTDSTHFVLATHNADYTGIVQPVAGQAIGVYDYTKGIWRKKTILSFTGTGPWTIVCDTTSAASDTSYTPDASANQPVCPWSDSLGSLTAPVTAYLAAMGPGEMFATFYDEGGNRQRRNPRPPKMWPHVRDNRITAALFYVQQIDDVALAEGDGVTTTVGIPAVSAYLQELRYLAAYPKS